VTLDENLIKKEYVILLPALGFEGSCRGSTIWPRPVSANAGRLAVWI